MNIKKTLLATAVTTAMGATAIEAQAAPILSADWSGLFTLLDSSGAGIRSYLGLRLPHTGFRYHDL